MNYTYGTLDDTEQLINLRLSYLYEHFKTIADIDADTIRKNLYTYFNKHLSTDLIAFIAKENNEIISTAFLVIIEKPANPNFINGRTGEILNVYTRKNYRKLGIATNLIKNIILYTKENNIDLLELKATNDGYNLYKKLGFNEEKSKCTRMTFIP